MTDRYVVIEQTAKWIKGMMLVAITAMAIGACGFVYAWRLGADGTSLDRISVAVFAGGLALAFYTAGLRWWYHA